jgi:hypothetical protein
VKYNISYIGVIIFFYFSIPKFDLVIIPGLPTGIRLQDILSLLILLNHRIHNVVFNILKKKAFFVPLFYIIALNCFGAILSDSLGSCIIGWFRVLQYLFVGLTCYYVFIKSNTFFVFIILLQLALSFLQFLKVVPVFDPGRGTLLTAEYAGSFGTAAELSYFSLILAILFAMKKKKYFSFITFFIPILSGVRAYFLSIPVVIICFFQSKLIKLSFSLITVLLIVTKFSELYERTSGVYQVFYHLVIETPSELLYLKESGYQDIGDRALGHRIGKWATAIAIISKSHFFFWGTGMYSAGGALDGGLLRMFLELGVPASLYFLFNVYRVNKLALLVFVLCNLFFDGYISSVVMPIYIAFVIFAEKEKNIKKSINIFERKHSRLV